MPVAKPFQSLQIYDILANIVPGSTFLIALAAIFRTELYIGEVNTSLVGGAFLIVAFVIGHGIQTLASELNGSPQLFGQIVDETRGNSLHKPSGVAKWLPENARSRLGFDKNEVDDFRITEVEQEFWPLCRDRFGLSDNFTDNGRLIQLVLSHIEATPSTRALRFQAIHSFHRSMWAMWFLVLAIAIISFGFHFVGFKPIKTRTLPVLIGVFVVSLLGIYLFALRKKKFNKKFVEYLIVDFCAEQIQAEGE